MIIRGHGVIVFLVWGGLLTASVVAFFLGQWSMTLVASMTLLVSLAPSVLSERYHLELPWPFFTGIVLFIFATLFLGEAFDFYDRFWWWDILMHGFSAIGFGLAGFVFIFALFEGDRYAAPAWAIAFISLTFAIAIGAMWEIFEFTMDAVFGVNMQKSGLNDTMQDLMVDTVGASIGALAGFGFLKGRNRGGLTRMIAEFVRLNSRLFKDFRPRK
jgi:hypothetical protein